MDIEIYEMVQVAIERLNSNDVAGCGFVLQDVLSVFDERIAKEGNEARPSRVSISTAVSQAPVIL